MTLKKVLEEKKISQEMLSRYFQRQNHKKSQSQISNWLTGKRKPDIASVYLLSRFLNCSTEDVIKLLLETRREKE
jgi:transcriptional regulator with XRE-family HTH domain